MPLTKAYLLDSLNLIKRHLDNYIHECNEEADREVCALIDYVEAEWWGEQDNILAECPFCHNDLT